MARGHLLVLRVAALLLGGFRRHKMAGTRRATHQLALCGQFEPLGNGLLGFLHDGKGSEESMAPTHCKGKAALIVSLVRGPKGNQAMGIHE